MSTVELIAQKSSALPTELQEEALRFVDYFLALRAQQSENEEWSRFSAEQLADQYSPAAAIYDCD